MDGLLVSMSPDVAANAVSSPEGLEMLVARLIGEFAVLPEVMAPGTTEITPKSFSDRFSSRHLVEVHPDGESAAYHMVPRSEDMEVVEHHLGDDGWSEVPLPSNWSVEIPSQQPLVPLAGFDKEGQVRLHEIIFYVPGFAPRIIV